MLCLSRRKNEKVMIGNEGAFVQVLEVVGDKVRLGFEFPKDVPVNREEVLTRPPKEN